MTFPTKKRDILY